MRSAERRVQVYRAVVDVAAGTLVIGAGVALLVNLGARWVRDLR